MSYKTFCPGNGGWVTNICVHERVGESSTFVIRSDKLGGLPIFLSKGVWAGQC